MRITSLRVAMLRSIMFMALFASIVSAQSLTTTFAGGSGFPGIMFDMSTVAGPILINDFDVNMDAGTWVRDPANAQDVQLLHVDLYDDEAAAPVLDDLDFYAACRSVLAEGGVMSVNLFGRNARFAHSLAKITQAFGAPQVCGSENKKGY